MLDNGVLDTSLDPGVRVRSAESGFVPVEGPADSGFVLVGCPADSGFVLVDDDICAEEEELSLRSCEKRLHVEETGQDFGTDSLGYMESRLEQDVIPESPETVSISNRWDPCASSRQLALKENEQIQQLRVEHPEFDLHEVQALFAAFNGDCPAIKHAHRTNFPILRNILDNGYTSEQASLVEAQRSQANINKAQPQLPRASPQTHPPRLELHGLNLDEIQTLLVLFDGDSDMVIDMYHTNRSVLDLILSLGLTVNEALSVAAESHV